MTQSEKSPEGVHITGVWLRSIGDELIVSVEIDGTWRKVISEHREGPMSHICEASGIRDAPEDHYLGYIEYKEA